MCNEDTHSGSQQSDYDAIYNAVQVTWKKSLKSYKIQWGIQIME